MPEYDVSLGNHDVVPRVTTVRVFANNQRVALREAFKAAEDHHNPTAWTVIDVKEVSDGAAA